MTLVLQIENYPALENGAPVQFPVPVQGAKIGRSANMDWTLPDQTRHISSHHFDILVQDGVFYLRDVSTNGTFYYDTRERVNGFHQLRHGDRFQVGTYLIIAVLQEPEQPDAQDKTVFMMQPTHAVAPESPPPVQPAPPPQPPVAAPPPPPLQEPQPPFPAPVAPLTPAPVAATPPIADPAPVQVPPAPTPPPVAQPQPDPFPESPDLAATQAPAYSRNPEPDPVAPAIDLDATRAPISEVIPQTEPIPPSAPPELETMESVPGGPIIPDDPFEDDPFFNDPIDPTPVEALDREEPDQEDLKKPDYSRIFREVTGPGLQSPPRADTAEFDDPDMMQAPPSVQIPDLDFIDDDLSDLSAPSIPPKTLAHDDIRGQLSLPPHQFLAMEQAEADKTEVPGNARSETSSDAILRAFCRGAGLPEDTTTAADAEALAEALGESTRIATREIKLMLDARASTKQFTRGGARTMRRGTNSNPLKFMPDTDEALDAMFLNPRDGYQDGAEALEEALTDLRVHQMALFAAIQPALIKMIEGLSPDEIETETEGGLMSGSGKSWERYKALYTDRTDGHDNGLLDVFLAHFAASYSTMIGGSDD